MLFFFKQKTAYEMRISDWSSDVCSSDLIGHAAWASADPGIQFDTSINDWHTCPADGRINASNPCSEYMFLDDTACNLASLNLMCFRQAAGKLDVEGFRHAVRPWAVTNIGSESWRERVGQ